MVRWTRAHQPQQRGRQNWPGAGARALAGSALLVGDQQEAADRLCSGLQRRLLLAEIRAVGQPNQKKASSARTYSHAGRAARTAALGTQLQAARST